MPSEVILEAAKRQREQEIELLTICLCAYPTERYRNGSGHSPTCPSHAVWTARHR